MEAARRARLQDFIVYGSLVLLTLLILIIITPAVL
jgi:hypothetical protein